MNNRLFNLPPNILSEIYKYDTTYRDILKNKILFDIWKMSFVQYKYNLLSNNFFINKPNLRKIIKTLLEYLFEDETSTWFKYNWYDNPTDQKPMTNDIHFSCHWNIYTFNIINNKLFTNIWDVVVVDVVVNDVVFVNFGLKYYPYKDNTTERYHTFKGIISKLHTYIDSAQYLYKYRNDEYTVLQVIK